MSLKTLKVVNISSILKWVTIVLSLARFVRSQDTSDYNELNNPSVLPLITQLLYAKLANMTSLFTREIGSRSSFCIKDPNVDWNKAFNFSSNLDFLSSCIQKTQGDIERRICTAAEMKLYFNIFFEANSGKNVRPNRNCNLTSWVSGCESGWGCSVGPSGQLDLQNSRDIPERTQDCQPCCEGFFCPRRLTCMIPCPLGSYCPLATLNKTSGICEPYSYELPPGKPNHTCGGANIWADVQTSSAVFCSAGSFCPTTTENISCSSGHYCRMGSTSEKPCFKLTSCNPNSANQNLHAYGVMVIAALCTILVIIYNCSDQILSTRERRLAKSREAAARSMRETAKARQRWRAAKDAAKKHASGFQENLSRTFTKKKSTKHFDKLQMSDKTESEIDQELYLPAPSSASSPSIIASSVEENKMEIRNELESRKQYSLQIQDSEKKVRVPKSKKMKASPYTQNFKYAYAQIEKEKEKEKENKHLTFSGVISMATNSETRKRPLVELSFRNLTLTLKAKNKHLLRCITGNIKPGRITAVMGPSGAGKTTFLSVLAGKPVGCAMSGLILINGRNESIHSYKKIVGFVPQDDIVHGNLTVEENLWFHAKCRLPAELPIADKVLVVERVIECLGLQAVRNSLVGTVEKRGISGGQRKRVNVGMEMVMEPSVLFLDEPTSGLDSASSQLLLRALRREALEGVNICMVVHQPSYTLFKMFDDLLLLAKGGFTVYLGPAKKIEEYFSSLAINVPDRMNPPDYYIDVLEGIESSTGTIYKELPVRWMLHNRYPVPPDLQHNATGLLENSTLETSASDVGQSFSGDLWQDVKSNVELRKDNIQHNFLRSKDLSNRRTPGVFRQYKYFLERMSKQRLREAKLLAVDYLILLLAGACLGSLTKSSEASFGALSYTYTVIAVSLLCKIAALRSFSLDKLHHGRESFSGMSSLAHFLAKDTIDHFNTIVKPVVYLSMFYFFTNPRSSFGSNYAVLLSLVYCVTGIAYALAIFFHPSSAQLFSVLLPVVLTLIASRSQDSEVIKLIANFGYSKWALEAFVIANAERYYGVWLITRCGSLMKSGYNIHEWRLCILVLVLTGVATRVVAYVGMITLRKK